VWLVTAGLNAFLSHCLLLYHYLLSSYVSAVARLYVDISAGIRSNVSHPAVLESTWCAYLSRSFDLPLACLVLDSALSLFHSVHCTTVHKWSIRWTPFWVSLQRYLHFAANPAEVTWSSGIEYESVPSKGSFSLKSLHQTSLLTHAVIGRSPHGPPTAYSFSL